MQLYREIWAVAIMLAEIASGLPKGEIMNFQMNFVRAAILAPGFLLISGCFDSTDSNTDASATQAAAATDGCQAMAASAAADFSLADTRWTISGKDEEGTTWGGSSLAFS